MVLDFFISARNASDAYFKTHPLCRTISKTTSLSLSGVGGLKGRYLLKPKKIRKNSENNFLQMYMLVGLNPYQFATLVESNLHANMILKIDTIVVRDALPEK